MYISIISKVGHAPPLFRADIRGSEVTTLSHCKIIYIQYNTISKCETMKCILDDVIFNSECGWWMYLNNIHRYVHLLENENMMKSSKDEDRLPSCL